MTMFDIQDKARMLKAQENDKSNLVNIGEFVSIEQEADMVMFLSHVRGLEKTSEEQTEKNWV